MSNPLREFRKSLGLTQQSLAAKLGVTQSTVAMWESRRRSVGNAELSALSDLGADIVAIVKWTSVDIDSQPPAGAAA